jgi:anaerobic selenocysteine-containing dehydrogenase
MPDGSFERIDVEQAMDEIAVVLRRLISEHGPRSVANYVGTAFIVNFPITRPVAMGFSAAIGSPMQFETTSIDQPGKVVAKGLHGVWMAPATGRVDPEIVLLIGQNPIASHSGFPMGNPGGWLAKQLAHGMKLVVIDPRRTDVGRRATLYLQPRPGNDPAILASLIHVILEERLYDREFVVENTSGLEELRAAVAPYMPGLVASVADVNADDLVQAARMYADAHRAFIAIGTGPSMNGYSTLVEYLGMNLMTLCGHWQREGELIQNAGVTVPTRHAKAQAMPPFPAYGFGERMRVRGLSESLSGVPTATAADEILLPGAGQVRALLSCAGNPVAAWPDQHRTVRAMQQLELLVSLDVRTTQTTRFAHYVIATRMSLEVPGITYFGDLFDTLGAGLGLAKAYGQYTPRIVEPPDGSQLIEEWEFYYGIAQRLGMTLRTAPFVPTANPYTFDMNHKPTTEELLEAHMVDARIPLDELKRHPHGAFFPSDLRVAPKDEGWEGRLDLANRDMLADLDGFVATLEASCDDGQAYPFRLISRRMKDAHNSHGYLHSSLRGRLPNPAFIHPADLERLGVASGDIIEIRSPHGVILGIAKDDPSMREGVVSMSHCFGGLPDEDDDVLEIGSPVARLCSVEDSFERYSGEPRMSNIPIAIAPASPQPDSDSRDVVGARA